MTKRAAAVWQKKIPERTYIAIEDLANKLGLLEFDVLLWLVSDDPELALDHRNRPCVPADYAETYSTKADYQVALRKALLAEQERRRNDEAVGLDEKLEIIRLELLKQYKVYILDLQKFHLGTSHDQCYQ